MSERVNTTLVLITVLTVIAACFIIGYRPEPMCKTPNKAQLFTPCRCLNNTIPDWSCPSEPQADSDEDK